MGVTIVLVSSGEQNAAFSYIILRLTYIRGLILIGRGSPDCIRSCLKAQVSTIKFSDSRSFLVGY